jgi:PAS domain S-box-containing protein
MLNTMTTKAASKHHEPQPSPAAESNGGGNLADFFALSADMLALADLSGRLVQLNASWERHLGFTQAELHEQSVLSFIHPEDRSALLEHIKNLQKQNTSTCFEGRCARKDGSYRWLGWTAASVTEQNSIYIFARDITQRKLSEQEVHTLTSALAARATDLERANGELKREMEVRSQTEAALKDTNAELEAFAYSVSHDLRAPLRAMQGFAQALLEDCASELSTTGIEYAQRIVSAANRLDSLIQDLLLYSRISQATLHLEPVNLDWAVSAALSQLEAPVRDSGAQIDLIHPLSSVIGHKSTLVQVIGNLVSNACKFVDPGIKPRIQISTETNGQFLRLSIQDNGIGIPPEFQARIFRVFERLHGVETYPGTGIGLAIVRKALERMGGRVGVRSAPNEGSHFWIELPTVPA